MYGPYKPGVHQRSTGPAKQQSTISERARGKIQGWSEKLLACAGRETLLKSVVQSIPTYPMSTFLLTKKVCKSLTSPMAKYFWSSSLDKKSLHCVSWKELATPKCKGGMGFRDPHFFQSCYVGQTRVAVHHQSHLSLCKSFETPLLPRY